MDWSDSWRGAFSIELRAEAIGLAFRGWPVLPGTYPAAEQWVGRSGAEQGAPVPVPVHQDWQDRLTASPEETIARWTGQPYTLLVATGLVLNAVEVGADLGYRAARVLRSAGVPVPIAATPSGRWIFLTATGGPLRPRLAEHADVTLHGRGSWIPLPPSPCLHGVVHWRVKPQVCGWHLPDADVIQDALTEALPADGFAPAIGGAQQLVAVDPRS
jgi:hypothetical protein